MGRTLSHHRGRWAGLTLALAALGCHSGGVHYFHHDPTKAHYQAVATAIEVSDVNIASQAEIVPGLEPRTLWNRQPTEYWDLGLEEAVQVALANNQVLRDLGGRVLVGGNSLTSVYDPAIQESDPRFGVEGALSAFDAQFTTQMFWEKNDRVINNLFTSGGARLFQQDVGDFLAQVQKRTATGSTVTFRNTVDYDANNQPVNLFPSAYDVAFDAEFRHPLLQGAGVEFNRIAGPGAQPGLYYQNGVLLARIDNDVALAEFEAGVRDLVSSVENAYWELYFAYRDLDAKVAARDSALETWRKVNRLVQAGGVGGDVSSQAQASAQYLAFKGEALNALSGQPNLINPRPGEGPFLGAGGVYAREADLRLILGLTTNDGRLIRPRDEPTAARVVFDWPQTLSESLIRRVELRRQQWIVKRRELELRAARNFLKPTLDFAGRYRWRGFGDDLIRSSPSASGGQFDNAYQTLTNGDFQEWQLGLLLDVPIGYRQGLAGVRNSQLKLARERSMLAEMERQVTHDLGAALRELHRAYDLSQTSFNLRLQQQARVEAVRREYEAGDATIDEMLAAQKDLAAAESGYFRSIVAYNLAIKQVHFQKGSLLDFNQVYLAEGPWPAKAYRDAAAKARHRAASRYLNYGSTRPREFSLGPAAQHTGLGEPAFLPPPAGAQPLAEGLPASGGPPPGANGPTSEAIPAPPAEQPTGEAPPPPPPAAGPRGPHLPPAAWRTSPEPPRAAPHLARPEPLPAAAGQATVRPVSFAALAGPSSAAARAEQPPPALLPVEPAARPLTPASPVSPVSRASTVWRLPPVE